MFKKSLAALAVLGAAAGYASAADVTLFGVVDTGLIYTHQTFADDSKADVNNFAMDSGVSSASRFGLKGTEELGNGLKVGFKLENGFQSDSGALKSEKRIFDREASVSLYSDFGTLSMGRMGGVGSGAGTYDLVLATADAFDGVKTTVQYSFNEDSVEETAREGSSAVNRYSSAALTGDFGALQTVLAYEFQNYKSFGAAAEHDDGQIVYLGGNYDCGFAKTFVMGQYFKGIKAGQLTAITEDDADLFDTANSNGYSADGVKGYVAAYFMDFAVEYATGDKDAKSYAFGAKYEYYLSKRTSVYTGAGFAQVKYDDDGSDKTTQAYLGLTHRF